MTTPVVARRVIVSGRVQGVWFRESCRREATALGVHGWVRNNADGTVEALLEGDEAAVRRVIEWMRTGPPLAQVTGIEVTEQQPSGANGFTVR